MNITKREEIFNKYPNWFGEEFNRFGRYLEINDGWIVLLEDFLSKLEKLNPPPNFSFQQIKQKFGFLTIYYTPECSVEIDELVLATEALAFKTCEVCGEPGRIRGNGFIKILCDKDFQQV